MTKGWARPETLALAIAAAELACTIPAFTCADDSQCAAQAQGGRCEADRHCSYPDPECASRRRYGEFAGELSRTCVDAPATTEGSSTVATLDGPATDATETGASGSTTSGTSSTGTSTTSPTDTGTTGNIPLAPLGHWPLDDQGPVAMDVSGNDHHGAREGGEWIDGQIGGAILFAVENHGIEIGADPAFDLEGAAGVTLMGWARFDAFVISNVPIVAKFGAYNLLFWGDDNPAALRPVMYLYPEGGTADGDTDGPLDQNGAVRCAGALKLLTGAAEPSEDATIWHHYTATYDVASRMLHLYVDGIEECAEDVSVEMQDGVIAKTTTGVQIGRWQSSGPTLMGGIDDVRIYDVALAPEDIAVIAAQAR
jgi:hypothetical protein